MFSEMVSQNTLQGIENKRFALYVKKRLDKRTNADKRCFLISGGLKATTGAGLDKRTNDFSIFAINGIIDSTSK